MGARQSKLNFENNDKRIVYGYFHWIYQGNIEFPRGIVEICCGYLSVAQCWVLKGDELEQFLATENTKLVRELHEAIKEIDPQRRLIGVSFEEELETHR